MGDSEGGQVPIHADLGHATHPSPSPRLLLLSPLPPPSGGIATWTHRLLTSGLQERWDVQVINTNPNAGAAGKKVRSAIKAARIAREVQQALAQHRPDVVHVNASAHWPGILKDLTYLEMAKHAGAATVLHVHGSRLHHLNARWAAPLRSAMHRIDRVLVLNHTMHERLALAGADVLRVDNFVDRWPEVDRSAYQGPTRFLFAGWIAEAKGVLELTEALARVPNAQLIFVGRMATDPTGSTEARLRDLIEAHNLSERIVFAGEHSLEQMQGAYAQADVFVLPSYTEGLPIALLEAMMSGLPSIVTPVGGMVDAIEAPQAGRVVPVRDVDALAQAMTEMCDPDVRRATGHRARQRALDRFETQKVVAGLEQVYRELLPC